MDKSNERIKRIFPSYFENVKLPEEAKNENIKVYRACISQLCDKESFTPTFEERGMKYYQNEDSTDPGLYSLSTYEKPKDVKRFLKMDSKYTKPYKIAFGCTHESCGLVQRTCERKTCKSSHVDWWLYEDAEPHLHFNIVDNFEEHLEMHRKR